MQTRLMSIAHPIVVLVLMMMLTSPSGAEPTPTVSRLMESPVSMLDWGLYRLRDSVKEGLSHGPTASSDLIVHTSYEWDSNRIVLHVENHDHPLGYDKDAKWWCTQLVKQTKSCLGIDWETGRPYSGDNSVAQEFFTHSGYEVGGDSGDLGHQLDAIIEVVVSVRKSDAGRQYLRCRAPLLGTELLFADIAWQDL